MDDGAEFFGGLVAVVVAWIAGTIIVGATGGAAAAIGAEVFKFVGELL